MVLRESDWLVELVSLPHPSFRSPDYSYLSFANPISRRVEVEAFFFAKPFVQLLVACTKMSTVPQPQR